MSGKKVISEKISNGRSLNYIGSKLTLSSFIVNAIEDISGGMKDKIFADIFAGTGIIPRIFKSRSAGIIASDLEYYSYVILSNYILNNKPFDYERRLSELNNLAGREGFIYKNYCLGGSGFRNFFSDENGKKIDAVRREIERQRKSGEISEGEYYFYLTSLLEAADRTANTASVYGAYLKHLKKTAKRKMTLTPPLFETGNGKFEVFWEDANELIGKIEGGVLYLDPPYNHRQYGANYHLLNTIARYDDFLPQGKTGLRPYLRSKYCQKQFVNAEFANLISKAKFKYIFLSYNNEGVMPFDSIRETMSDFGRYDLISLQNYQRFKADKDANRKYKAAKTTEYLHILEKSG